MVDLTLVEKFNNGLLYVTFKNQVVDLTPDGGASQQYAIHDKSHNSNGSFNPEEEGQQWPLFMSSKNHLDGEGHSGLLSHSFHAISQIQMVDLTPMENVNIGLLHVIFKNQVVDLSREGGACQQSATFTVSQHISCI